MLIPVPSPITLPYAVNFTVLTSLNFPYIVVVRSDVERFDIVIPLYPIFPISQLTIPVRVIAAHLIPIPPMFKKAVPSRSQYFFCRVHIYSIAIAIAGVSSIPVIFIFLIGLSSDSPKNSIKLCFAGIAISWSSIGRFFG